MEIRGKHALKTNSACRTYIAWLELLELLELGKASQVRNKRLSSNTLNTFYVTLQTFVCNSDAFALSGAGVLAVSWERRPCMIDMGKGNVPWSVRVMTAPIAEVPGNLACTTWTL